MKIKEIDKPVAFNTITKILRRIYAYPEPQEKFSSLLFIKFFTLAVFFGLPCFVGLIGHLYISINAGDLLKTDLIENIMVILQMNICFGFISILFIIGNKMMKFFERIKKNIIEKPEDMDRIVKDHERLISVMYLFTVAICLFYAIDNYYIQTFCEGEKLLNDSRFVCGMSLPLWYPVKLNTFFESFVKIEATLSLMIYFPIGLIIPSIGLGCVTMIESRIKHLKKMLGRIDFSNNGNLEILTRQLHNCIIYSSEIRSLVGEMNDSVGFIFAPEYSLMTVMLALLEYQSLRKKDVVTVMRLMGWLAMQCAICLRGQQLLNKSIQLTDFVYNMPWYDMPPELRSTFRIFFASVQKPMSFMAKPIVVLNNEFLSKVLKGSYSLVMFIETWSGMDDE